MERWICWYYEGDEDEDEAEGEMSRNKFVDSVVCVS